MLSIKLADDEQIITVFNPPKRAAFYSFVKNSPIKLLIILFLFYHVLSGLYAPGASPVKKALSNVPMEQTLDKPAQPAVVQVNKTSDTSVLKTGKWRYEYHGTGSDFKPFFLGALALFLSIYLYSQIKKNQDRVVSISYTITNKRVIIFSAFGKEALQSIYYVNQKYCSILQTPLHRILRIYYICLSSNPVKSNSLNGISQFIMFGANDIVDILTREQAENFVTLFNNDGISKASSDDKLHKISAVENDFGNRSPNNSSEKIIMCYEPRYIFSLLAKYFKLYGFVYSMVFLILFANPLYKSGFFELFYSWDRSIKFIAGYLLVISIIAFIRGLYQIKTSKFIFTQNELIFPPKSLFSSNRNIPYQDISSLSVRYSGFNLYHVNFTAKINLRILSFKKNYMASQVQLVIPGLSKKNAEQIPLLIKK